MRSMIWPSSAGLRAGAGDNAPMPPVLGPVSPSPRRLKSWAVASGSTLLPSTRAKKLASSPLRKSSMTISRPACPKRHSTRAASTARHAASRSAAIVTPLPAASPSTLTTIGAPRSAMKALAATGSRKLRCAAVGMPASAQSCFIELLEASIAAAAEVGPNAAIPSASSASTSPRTSGASGPTTTKSILSRRQKPTSPEISLEPIGTHSASSEIPAFPGAQYSRSTSGEAAIAQARACSRPPEPTISTRITCPPLSLGRRAGDQPAASLFLPASHIIWR